MNQYQNLFRQYFFCPCDNVGAAACAWALYLSCSALPLSFPSFLSPCCFTGPLDADIQTRYAERASRSITARWHVVGKVILSMWCHPWHHTCRNHPYDGVDVGQSCCCCYIVSSRKFCKIDLHLQKILPPAPSLRLSCSAPLLTITGQFSVRIRC